MYIMSWWRLLYLFPNITYPFTFLSCLCGICVHNKFCATLESIEFFTRAFFVFTKYVHTYVCMCIEVLYKPVANSIVCGGLVFHSRMYGTSRVQLIV